MSDDLERAQEGMERAHEEHVEHGDTAARDIAILISILAAALAIGEMQEKGALNEYTSNHIQVSDDYAFYQAKTLRSNLYALHAEMLADLPNAADPAIRKQIDAARATVARLDDDEKTQGRKQLQAVAKAHEGEREHWRHRYEMFELVVGALQIAIVLASVSVVTRRRAFAWAAGIIGGGAILAGVLVYGSIL